MSNVLHPVVTEFERLLNSDEILMADFYADRCGPCRMLAPIIEEIADEYDGKVTVVKIDVDGDGRELAYKFGISSIPTVMFFKDGSEYTREIGLRICNNFIIKYAITQIEELWRIFT